MKRFTSTVVLFAKNMKIGYAISVFSLLLFCGCSNPDENAVNSFKTIAKHLQEKKTKKGDPQFSDFYFNVKKNDSLNSPYVGVLKFKNDMGSGIYLIECQFAMQEGKWIHKNIDVNYESETKNEGVKRLGEAIIGVWIIEVDDILSKFLNCPMVNKFN